MKVQVADEKNMDQIQEGKAPFNRLPKEASDVQLFPHMPNALISAEKIVKIERNIPDDPIATVVNKLTNEVVMEAEFDPRSCIWNVYQDSPVAYKFSEEQKVKSLGLGMEKEQQKGIIIHLANNAYQLKTKKEIVEFYHTVAG